MIEIKTNETENPEPKPDEPKEEIEELPAVKNKTEVADVVDPVVVEIIEKKSTAKSRTLLYLSLFIVMLVIGCAVFFALFLKKKGEKDELK